MAGVLAIGETLDGQPTRLTLELATIAAALAAETGSAASVLLVGNDARAAAGAVAAHGPRVIVARPSSDDIPAAAAMTPPAVALIERERPDVVLVAASADGKDVAGALVGLTDLPLLQSGGTVVMQDGRPGVSMTAFGGRLITQSSFTGGRGIILVRPGSVTATTAAGAGGVEELDESANSTTPLASVRVLDRVVEAATGALIDDARVIIGGGRGVAGTEGFEVLQALARQLDGAVGATRAAVDSGWIDFAQQIGQTGKTVKPELYIACGISGAIQHKVGVQSANTIIAINKDPDAPIVEFADVVVIGDLFEIVPLLTAALRERAS